MFWDIKFWDIKFWDIKCLGYKVIGIYCFWEIYYVHPFINISKQNTKRPKMIIIRKLAANLNYILHFHEDFILDFRQ